MRALFTGIVEETGVIQSVQHGGKSSRLTIKADKVLSDCKEGDSICTSGVCLTAAELGGSTFTADVMAETMRRTKLGDLKPGSQVNLERAMQLNGRFGGHIVSGHIDGTGVITNMQRESNAVWITISADDSILKYIIEKGSIAIDGISLTVAYVDSRSFKVSIIPHTASHTTLLGEKVGNRVNLECDMIGKYVEKLMSFKEDKNESKGITEEFLIQHGF